MQEVSGSIPLTSTNVVNVVWAGAVHVDEGIEVPFV